MRVAMVVLTASAIGAAGCGHSGWVASNSGKVTLYTESKIEHKQMQQWLELSHEAYRVFFPEVQFERIDAVWMKRAPGELTRLYGPNADPSAGWTLETVPSRGPIGKTGLIVLERRQELRTDMRGFGFHTNLRDETIAKRQMAHLFVMKALGTAPLWLQVGLSRYLAKYRLHYQGNAWIVCHGSNVFDEPPAAGVGRAGSGRTVTIPLDELFRADWYEYDRSRRHWYEYTAYALVHYLIHGENNFNRTRFSRFLAAVKAGKSSDEALEGAYPNVLHEEWDTKVAEHIRPHRGQAAVAATPDIVQGLCLPMHGQYNADFSLRTRPADKQAVDTMLDDLEQVDLFRKHSGWMPTDVVDAEASKRGRPRGTGRGTGAPGREGQPGGQGDDGQPREVDVTNVRETAPK